MSSVFTFFSLTVFLFLLFVQGCSSKSSPPSCTLGTGADVTVNGLVTFDRVPHFSAGGLDYNLTSKDPALGVVVEVKCSASIISSTTTDANGRYSLTVPGNTSDIFIRVKAQILQTSVSYWNFQVVDNTSSQSLYVMDGSFFNSGTTDSTRDLHAASGWTGNGYGSTRVAAPFAILDSVYKAVSKLVAINSAIQFPPLKFNWSINNTRDEGDTALGQISSSFFNGISIYILGAEDADTDEYDEHIIVHEFGHYFEHNFSRSDSIGGSHAIGHYLDMRVAFSEGFGNVFSAIVLDNPVYKDSSGPGQGSYFKFNMESDSCTTVGWYSECSVHNILYDIFDSVDDQSDTLSLGFKAIYDVMINQQKNTTALTSIFPFVKALKADNPADVTAINALFSSHSINSSTDEFGSAETNKPSNNPDVLPIYTNIVPGETSPILCTNDDFLFSDDTYNDNKVSSRRFLKLTVPSNASFVKIYTITANHISGANSPGLSLYNTSGWFKGTVGNSIVTGILQAGAVIIIESYDTKVSDTTAPAASACYEISVSN